MMRWWVTRCTTRMSRMRRAWQKYVGFIAGHHVWWYFPLVGSPAPSLFLFLSLVGVRPLPCKRLTLEKLVAWGTSPPRSTCKAIVYLWRRYHRNPRTVVLFPVATFSCQRRTPSPPLARPTTQSLDRSVARCRNCGPATACVWGSEGSISSERLFYCFCNPAHNFLSTCRCLTNNKPERGRWPVAGCSIWLERNFSSSIELLAVEWRCVHTAPLQRHKRSFPPHSPPDARSLNPRLNTEAPSPPPPSPSPPANTNSPLPNACSSSLKPPHCTKWWTESAENEESW